jgi:hypothetical protein
MPRVAVYKIFISHGFKEHEDYARFVELLEEYKPVTYTITSVPTSYKYRGMSKSQLEEQLRAQIKAANCFIALDSVHESSEEWLEYELKAAGKLGVPIVAIKKWKSRDISSEVEGFAKIVSGWNIDSIADALKQS